MSTCKWLELGSTRISTTNATFQHSITRKQNEASVFMHECDCEHVYFILVMDVQDASF